MKKQLLVTFLLFFAIAYVNAQTSTLKPSAFLKATFSGIITDAITKTPLPGATIFLPDLKMGAISDNQGYFTIRSVSNGKHLVEISYQGYATIIQNIVFKGNSSYDFALVQAVIEQEGVTVTGTSFATRLKQSPQPVRVVKHDELETISSTNIIDALAKLVPGVTALSTGPAIAKPVIRGLGYNRVVVVNDGVRQEGQQWGDEHGIEVDDYSVQRIEVLKGPASLIYGSDAIAGIINIQSQTAVSEGMAKLNFGSEYQTNNKLRGFYGNVAATKHGFSWNAYGSYKGAQDYENKYDGHVFNSKFYNKNFGGMIAYNGSWGNSRLLVSSFDQHLGIIEGDRDSATGAFTRPVAGGGEIIATQNDFEKIQPEIPAQRIRHFKVTSDNVFNIGRNRLDIVAGLQHNQREEFGNADEPDLANAFFDLKTLNYAARFHVASDKNWKISTGVTGMFQKNENKGEEVLIPDYSIFDIGAFLFSQYTKNKLSVSGGARFDTRHVTSEAMLENDLPKFDAFTKNFSNASGSIGLAYEATKAVTLKLNLARGFRAPNLAELASNGAHEGTNRYEVGNNNLKNEISMQIDGGVEINTEHLSVTANLFYNNISRFIFYEKMQTDNGGDSIITDDETGDALNVFHFNQHDAHLFGGELNVDIHPHPLDWLHFENTFSYTRGQFSDMIDGSDNIPYMPAGHIISELRCNFYAKAKTVRNFYCSITGDYTLAQKNAFEGYNTETPTGSYYLLNAALGTDIASKGKTIVKLHLSAFNLLDAAYQSHLSRLKYAPVNNVTGRQGVFDMGRNFTIKAELPLNFKI